MRIILFVLTFLFSCTYTEKIDDFRVIDSKVDLKLLKSFNHLGYIVRLWADKNNIYISSAPNFQIYQYDLKGNLIRKYGKSGPAPWENGTLWYFEKTSDNKYYWVHDYSKQMVKKFNLSNDTMIENHKLMTINNIILDGNDNFYIPKINFTTKNFHISKLNIKSKEFCAEININRLVGLDSKQAPLSYSDYIFEGDFCKNSKGQILYYCYNAGISFLINTNNDSVSVIKDVRQLPIPKAYLKNKEVHLAPKNMVCLSGALDEKYMYLLTTKTQPKGLNSLRNNTFYIDIYNIETFKYLKSFELPKFKDEEIPFKIAKKDNNLIVAYEDSNVGIYKINL